MKEDLSRLWRFVAEEVRLALLWERTKGDPAQLDRILEAQQRYFDTLQTLYEQWRKKNPQGQLETFLYPPSREEANRREKLPHFSLPPKKGGNRKPITGLHKQLVLNDYKKCFQGLKQKLKPKYRNPAARKLAIEAILKNALVVGPESFDG